MVRNQSQLRPPHLRVEILEGDVHENPLAIVLVVVPGQEHGGHCHFPFGGNVVGPLLQAVLLQLRLRLLCGLLRPLVLQLQLVVHVAFLVGLPQELGQGHVRCPPGAVHILLDSNVWLTLPRDRHHKALQSAACKALGEPLHGQLQRHLRNQGMIVGEHALRNGIVTASIGQPVRGEAVGELGNVAGDILQQHAAAIGHLNVHVATQAGQNIHKIGPDALRSSIRLVLAVVALGVMQAKEAGGGVIVRSTRLLRPAASGPGALRALHQAGHHLVVCRDRGTHALLELRGLGMLQPNQQVEMNGASSVVELGRGLLLVDVSLALAILVLQAAEEVQNRLPTRAILRGKDVAFPGFLFRFRRRSLLIEARQKAKHGLGEDVGDVERLGHRQLQPSTQQLLCFIFHPLVVRKAPLVRGHGDEHRRQAQLFDHVNQSSMPRPPVLRGETVAGHGHPHGPFLSHRVLFAAQSRPKPEIVDELEKLVGGPVAQHRAKNFG